MLIQDFFKITGCVREGATLKAAIVIDKTHPIFDGHFPGLPVVPGVTMMEMIREAVQHHQQAKYFVRAADNMKFLTVINPNERTEVEAHIQVLAESDTAMEVNASLAAEGVTYFKMKATLEKQA